MSSTREFADGKLLVALGSHVGQLLFNRPERKNAIDAQMWRTIPTALDWLTGQGARIIVISGAGGKDFSAGADIAEFDTHRKDAETSAVYEQLNAEAFKAIRKCSVPTIAAIRGICFGGGFGVAAATDLRLADTTARFAIPAARLGLAYPVEAMVDIVATLGPQYAKLALFSAGELPANELVSCGALLPLVPPEALDQSVLSLAQRIAANAPLSIKASKTAVNAIVAADSNLLGFAQEQGEITFSSRDYEEGRAAFKDRRKPHFTGE